MKKEKFPFLGSWIIVIVVLYIRQRAERHSRNCNRRFTIIGKSILPIQKIIGVSGVEMLGYYPFYL